ncbi:MAG: GGDEF domain-containing protein [Candidatus Competibacter denitrificans]|jgi:diguanylate cyclase (GGDEF)-like protein
MMSLREIRYRLRHDFQLAVLSWMALVALSIITPFTIYRLLKADWMMTIVDSVLILAIIATVLYAWYTGNARRSCQALMYFDFVLGIVGVHLFGTAILGWVYPMLVSNFFLASPRHAAVTGTFFLLMLLIIEHQIFSSPLAGFTFMATGLLVCFYTYVFAQRAELQYRQLEDLASRDTLTGAFNRRTFQQELQRAYQAFQRDGTPYGLLVIDIDHFKQINDTWGHDAGDEILVRLAQLIEGSVRKTDRFFRFGGEEFVLLVFPTNFEALGTMASDTCLQVEREIIYEGKPLTVSIGGAVLCPQEAPSAWFARADAALYSAKHQGRNRAIIDCSYESILPIDVSASE